MGEKAGGKGSGECGDYVLQDRKICRATAAPLSGGTCLYDALQALNTESATDAKSTNKDATLNCK